ncbi:MAG TPA: hypothetical protein VER76_09470 [Pyrinomonadaceae bacterium]|nr:hypothetical protein [Pyrinomonadaceae bacterium]
MKHKLLYLVFILTFLLCGVSAYGQGSSLPGNKKPRTVDDYRPRTLKQIVSKAAAGGHRDKESGVVLHGNILPSRVKVIYAGSTRPLPQNRKDVLVKWAQRFAGDPAHYTVPYETEALFVEGRTKHWLAVRRDFAAGLTKELKKGDAVFLYLIRLGGVQAAGKWEWLMLVESYLPAN